MSTTLKAIETVYNGYRFRSRLEARWAVFFDTLGIRYEYEKEGYDLDGVWYLPDFWLPEQKCWVEIKGHEPTDEEKEKADKLAQASNHPVVFMGEMPKDIDDWSVRAWGQPGRSGGRISFYWPKHEAHLSEQQCLSVVWTQCRLCGNMTLFAPPVNSYNRETRKDAWTYYYWTACGCLEKALEIWPDEGATSAHGIWMWIQNMFWWNTDIKNLADAFDAARQARFEHGAHGK